MEHMSLWDGLFINIIFDADTAEEALDKIIQFMDKHDINTSKLDTQALLEHIRAEKEFINSLYTK